MPTRKVSKKKLRELEIGLQNEIEQVLDEIFWNVHWKLTKTQKKVIDDAVKEIVGSFERLSYYDK